MAFLIAAPLMVVALVGLLVIRWRRRAPRSRPGDESGFFVEVREELRLCRGVARVLASRGDSWLMIEGPLEDRDLEGIEWQPEPPEGLGHHTVWSWPREQTACVPLRPENITVVCDRLLPRVVDHIDHVQMSHRGRLVFGAYDHFGLAWVSEDLSALLRQLEGDGTIANPSRSPDDREP